LLFSSVRTNKEWIRGVYDKVHLESHQRVNHFRNFYELTRKDLLIKNLKRAKRSLTKDGRDEEAAAFDFFPDTFSLPAEYALFVEAFKKTPGISWIMKPVHHTACCCAAKEGAASTTRCAQRTCYC